jgi:hypothetical protein
MSSTFRQTTLNVGVSLNLIVCLLTSVVFLALTVLDWIALNDYTDDSKSGAKGAQALMVLVGSGIFVFSLLFVFNETTDKPAQTELIFAIMLAGYMVLWFSSNGWLVSDARLFQKWDDMPDFTRARTVLGVLGLVLAIVWGILVFLNRPPTLPKSPAPVLPPPNFDGYSLL